MKKFTKIALSSALAVGLGLGGVALAGCGKQPEQAKLEVVQEFKDEYYIGEESVDTTGALFAYTDEEGKTIHLTAEDVTISGFFSTTAGEWNMVIKYEDTTMLYPYTIIEPAFVEYGVPYYTTISKEMTGAETDMHSTFIFNEDGSLSCWQTSILPTLNNADELFADEAQQGFVGKIEECTKTIDDGKYIINFDMEMGGPTPIETTVIIEDENTITVEQIIQTDSDPYTITLKKAGNEDAKVEYGAYYYTVDPNNAEEGNEWYIVYQFTKDGFVNLASSEHEIPTKDNLDDIIGNGEVYPEGPISQYAYASYVEGGDFVLDMGYFVFHIDKEGNVQNVIPLGEGEDPLIYDMIKIV